MPRTALLAALIAAIGRDPEVRAWREARVEAAVVGRSAPAAVGAAPPAGKRTEVS